MKHNISNIWLYAISASLVVALVLTIADLSQHYAMSSEHMSVREREMPPSHIRDTRMQRQSDNVGTQTAVHQAPPRELAFRPPQGRSVSDIVVQGIFIFVITLVSMFATERICTKGHVARRPGHFFAGLGVVLGIAAIAVMCLPLFSPADADGLQYPPLAVLKIMISAVLGCLLAYIYLNRLYRIYMELQNEKLKTENMVVQYQAMCTQLNPHFFFNSLNTLASLVREDDKTKSLEYIERMSAVFRYILAADTRRITTLGDEVASAEAYMYLLRVRFAEGLELSINVPAEFHGYSIPVLTLQPLIENAVKHNRVSSSTPLHIHIGVLADDTPTLVVSNNITPRLSPSDSTQTGLNNLRTRYRLLMQTNIRVEARGEMFVVELPIAAPHQMLPEDELLS